MKSHQDRWTVLIDDFASSGLTVHRFCVQRGIAVSSFHAWKRRLREIALTARRQLAFVEAVVDGDHDHLHDPASASGAAAPVVELRRGRRIAVPQGFDEATLARLILLLERLDIAHAGEVRA